MAPGATMNVTDVPTINGLTEDEIEEKCKDTFEEHYNLCEHHGLYFEQDGTGYTLYGGGLPVNGVRCRSFYEVHEELEAMAIYPFEDPQFKKDYYRATRFSRKSYSEEKRYKRLMKRAAELREKYDYAFFGEDSSDEWPDGYTTAPDSM